MCPSAEPALDWGTLPVEPGIRLRITRAMPSLDTGLERVVAAHWARASALRPLFNGRVFCADRIAPDVIEGHWTEYRRAVAQMAEPGLFPRLGIRNLAVCGVLLGPDGVAVGRREANSVYQPGLWQMPPAGSVDQSAAEPGGASWRRALLTELEEEMGLLPSDVTGLRPLALVQHPSGVLDLGIRIDTRLDRETIVARQRGCADQEYDAILVSPADRVLADIARLGGALVPSSAVFLACAGAV